MTKLVIKPHRPWRNVIVTVATGATVALLLLVYIAESEWFKIEMKLSDVHESQSLERENQRMKDTIGKLEKRIIKLERMTQMERQTIRTLQSTMIEHQDRIYSLKEELEFYRSAMSSNEQSDDLNIHGLRVERNSSPRGYYMTLILTHAPRDGAAKISGALTILLEGERQGEAETINIREIMSQHSSPLAFDFVNFERIVADVLLPEHFIAHRVIIQAQRDDNRQPLLERIFDWSEVTNTKREN